MLQIWPKRRGRVKKLLFVIAESSIELGEGLVGAGALVLLMRVLEHMENSHRIHSLLNLFFNPKATDPPFLENKFFQAVNNRFHFKRTELK